MLNIWITIKFYFDVKLEIKVNFLWYWDFIAIVKFTFWNVEPCLK